MRRSLTVDVLHLCSAPLAGRRIADQWGSEVVCVPARVIYLLRRDILHEKGSGVSEKSAYSELLAKEVVAVR